MEIVEIVVSAGRTFNHPFEDYSNLRPQVTLKAALQAGEDAGACVKQLQAKAESLVEDHKQMMLKTLHRLHEYTVAEREIANVESELRIGQGRLERLREQRIAMQMELPDTDAWKLARKSLDLPEKPAGQ